ncbi:MAG: hypothetical protein ACRDZ6_03390 [Acidimicrobiales bacterium]
MDLELLDPLSCQEAPEPLLAGPDALVVRSVTLHGGETTIRGRRADFARIILAGVRLDGGGRPGRNTPREIEAAVLEAADAEHLARGLHQLIDRRVRSSATPAVVARGTWSWRSEPPRPDDLYVTGVEMGDGCKLSDSGRPMVHLDLSGALMFESHRRDAPVRRRAVFPVLRQAQVLVSSLAKCVQGVRLSREWNDPSLSFTWREVTEPRRPLQPWQRREAYLAEEAARWSAAPR